MYYSIVILTILYYLRVADLMGITSPYPRENIIAGNYILADMKAYLDKNHRQQNNEILIKHSPGIGECFLFLSIQLTNKIKNFHQGAVKMPLSVLFYVRLFWTGKYKNFSSRGCIYALHLLYMCKNIF